MPAFEDLPRELRQEILKLAFDHAIDTDIDFNKNIERYIRSYAGFYRLEQKPTKDLLRLLGPVPQSDDHWHPDSFAPHLCSTLESLRKAFPTIIDDIDFTFSKALNLFEKDVQRWKETERDYCHLTSSNQTALYQHAERTWERGELFDFGVGIENDGCNLAYDDKPSEKMVKSFNSVVRTHHTRR
ncbi:hypothetical protein E6O75_ATG01565 [Venturia nashicola]|uniref:Uncharacterized protein n=1 Tax=Venturia nashicola TaxID=86259 RepID=A0A4Z1PCI0_9PEZI|nr:hypothetical protein E6O75_ATG01565 [Venturia nashicola]